MSEFKQQFTSLCIRLVNINDDESSVSYTSTLLIKSVLPGDFRESGRWGAATQLLTGPVSVKTILYNYG